MSRNASGIRRRITESFWAKVARVGIFPTQGESFAKEHMSLPEEEDGPLWGRILMASAIVGAIAFLLWFGPSHETLFPSWR